MPTSLEDSINLLSMTLNLGSAESLVPGGMPAQTAGSAGQHMGKAKGLSPLKPLGYGGRGRAAPCHSPSAVRG